MAAFLNSSKCRTFPGAGYLYCPDICFGTVTYAVDPAQTADFKLRVSDKGGRAFEFPGFYYHHADALKNDWLRQPRYFSAALPLGDYTLSFRNKNGQIAWPSYAEATFEEPQCDDTISASTVSLQVPLASSADCRELIRNGDIEASSSAAAHWLQHEAGLRLLPSAGLGGSKAVSDTTRTTSAGAIGQFLDSRCLIRGRQYEVRAWVKLMQSGSVISCDSISGCPQGRLRIRKPPSDSSVPTEYSIDVATYFVRPHNSEGWNLLQSVFTVDERIATAPSVSFFVERRSTGKQLILDNVSVSLVESNCNELVFNGNFGSGSNFWEPSAALNSLKMNIVNVGGNRALEMTGRTSLIHSPQQDIRIGCMKPQDWFQVTARFRLKNANGSLFACNPTRPTGNLACPRLKLRAFVDFGLASQQAHVHSGGSVATTDHGVSGDGWFSMSGHFQVTDADIAADRLVLAFDQVSAEKAFVIDDVSITPVDHNCGNVIRNGDGGLGTKFWRTWVNNGNAIISVVPGVQGNAVKLSHRHVAGDGLHQYIDPYCMDNQSSLWRLSCRMKLINKVTGQAVACDPFDNSVSSGCPPLRVAGWKGNTKVVDEKYAMTNRPTWAKGAFNNYRTEFTAAAMLADCDRISIGFREFNVNWDVAIDSLVMSKIVRVF